jgi:hypothetical protein
MRSAIATRWLASLCLIHLCGACSAVEGERGLAIESKDDPLLYGVAPTFSPGASAARFGGRVALRRDYAVIASPNETNPTSPPIPEAGAVRIYRRGSTDWGLVQTLRGGTASGHFGFALDLDPSTLRIAILGNDSGGNVGSLLTVLKRNVATFDVELSEGGGAWKDVAFDSGNATGDRLAVVGPPGVSVRFRDRTSGVWGIDSTLRLTDGTNALTGTRVALRQFALVVTVDSVWADCAGNPPAKRPEIQAFAWVNDPSLPQHGSWILEENVSEIQLPCSTPHCHCGTGLGSALALTGDTLFIGESGYVADGAGGRVYALPSYPPQKPVSYCFQTNCRTPGTLLPKPASAGDGFGASVATDGDRVVAGAPSITVGGKINSGMVYTYSRRVGNVAGWVLENTIYMASAIGNLFGASLAVAGNVALVGAPGRPAAQELFLDHDLPDFNNDGVADLAIGAPLYAPSSNQGPIGTVDVSLGNGGTGSGLTAAGTLDESTTSNGAQAWSLFGVAETWGYFHGHAHADLVVGAPHHAPVDGSAVGSFTLYHGAAATATALSSPQVFNRGPAGILGGPPGTTDYWGWALAAGDFDGDGYDDLAVGAPLDGMFPGGSVQIIPGSAAGLNAMRASIIPDPASPDAPQAGDQFGYVLAVGDFNCDGYDDLAVGAPQRPINGAVAAGRVYVFPGSSSGLVSSPSILSDAEGGDLAEANDTFGFALAAGNLNGDTNLGRQCADLVVGVPGQTVRGASAAGAVAVFSGSQGTGPSMLPLQMRLAEGADSFLGETPAASDSFGTSVAVLRANMDRYDDLVIGAPGKDGGKGAIYVAAGNSAAVSIGSTPSVRWEEDDPGIAHVAGDGFWWGQSLAALDDGTLAVMSFSHSTSSGTVTIVRLVPTASFALGFTGKLQQTTFPTPMSANSDYFGWAMTQRRAGR